MQIQRGISSGFAGGIRGEGIGGVGAPWVLSGARVPDRGAAGSRRRLDQGVRSQPAGSGACA